MKWLRGSICLLLVWTTLFAVVSADGGPHAAPSQPADYGRNLLQNGDFSGGSHEHWFVWPEDRTHVTIAAFPGDSGNMALKLTAAGIPPGWQIAGISQSTAVRGGEKFNLGAKVFVESFTASSTYNVLFTVQVRFYRDYPFNSQNYAGHAFEDINRPNEEGTYTHIAFEGEIPQDARFAQVELHLKSRTAGEAGGTVYIDDVRLSYDWAPRNLAVDESGRTDNRIPLVWQPPGAGQVEKYEIWQGDHHAESFSDFSLIGYSTEPRFTATGLKPVTAYQFYVRAISADGYASSPSLPVRAATRKQPGTITVMPLGASITEGLFIPGGYRYPLWQKAAAAGHAIDFVGSLTDNGPNDPDFTDLEHEGHRGFHIWQLTQIVSETVEVYQPDLILLFIGTNNMWNQDSADLAPEELRQLLSRLTESDKLTHTGIAVATITGIYRDKDVHMPRIDAYNEQIRRIVDEWLAGGHNVGLVDMAALLDESYFPVPEEGDSEEVKRAKDRFHPYFEGYAKMADIWFDALDAFATTGQVQAKNPSTPVLTAVYDEHSAGAWLTWTASTDNIAIDRYDVYHNGKWTASVTGTVYGDRFEYRTGPLLGHTHRMTRHDFEVVAVDTAANRSTPATASVMVPPTGELIPPPAPIGLEIIDISHDRAVLGWQPADDPAFLHGYHVYRDGVRITDDPVPASELRYTAGSLAPETSYAFAVTSVDVGGQESEPGEAILAETLAAPPTGLHAAGMSGTGLRLAWNEATDRDGIAGYRIYMDGQPIGETPETFFDVDGLVPGRTYLFQVSAVDKLGMETKPGNGFPLTMDLAAPVLIRGESTATSVTIEWQAVAGATAYHVDMDGIRMDTTVLTTYTVHDLEPNTTYNFTVTAVRADGKTSFPSHVRSVKTKPNAPVNGGGGGGSGNIGGGAFFPPPAVMEDEGGLSLITPDENELLVQWLGTDGVATIPLTDGDLAQGAEVALSGPFIRLAEEKTKTIRIRFSDAELVLPPGWAAPASDGAGEIRIRIVPVPANGLPESAGQHLQPLGPGFRFAATADGAPIRTFGVPVSLGIKPHGMTRPANSGLYAYNEHSRQWEYAGGTNGADGRLTARLPGFSLYAAMESGKTFDDIGGHWARTAIEALAAKQIVSGITDTTFVPAKRVTRAEFSAMIVRALRLKAAAGELPFADVREDDWFYGEVKAAWQAGIVHGHGDGAFRPNTWITREQMTVMIMTAYAHAGGVVPALDGASPERTRISFAGTQEAAFPAAVLAFSDHVDISAWARPHAALAYELGLIHGTDGAFLPADFADRAQAAALIHRLLAVLPE